jgi:phage terminase small subunit
MRKTGERFTQREIKFIQLYHTAKTPAEAARKAGYTEKNSANAAYKLLKRAQIVAEIERRQAKTNEQMELSRERILTGLLAIFEGDGKDCDKINSAAQINKMQGFYAKEKVEMEHSGQISCVLLIPDNGRDKDE